MSSIVWFICTNTLLSGSLPSNLGHMVSLKRLALSDNLLTGSIPHSVAELQDIQQLILHNNHLSGSIPLDKIATLTKLEDLLLQNNMFIGDLIGNGFSAANLSLINVDFSSNRNCSDRADQRSTSSGDIRCGKELYHWDCLSRYLQLTESPAADKWTSRIDPRRNSAVGTVEDCLFNMSSLRTLHVSGNGFRGTLPNLATVSPILQDLSLSHNDLTGSIPRAFQSRTWLNLDLSYNKLSNVLMPHFAPLHDNSSLSLAVNRLSGGLPH
eukprot:gene38215-47185_t